MKPEEFSRKFMDAADAVGKKTVSLIEEGKLHIQIRDVEREMEKSYRKIGEHMYHNCREMLDGPIQESVDTLDELSEKLMTLKNEQAQAKGMKICENCRALNAKNSAYCQQCGDRLDD